MRIYQILEKYHMDKWFRKENLVVLVLTGILLSVIALPVKEKDSAAVQETGVAIKASEDHEEEKVAVSATDVQDYISRIESKLESLLSEIEGAGKVRVMITIQESETLIVEKDKSGENEKTIYEDRSGSSIPYVIKTIYPKIEGVVVIAEGANTGKVKQHITEAIQALFDISIHKIKVTGS